MTPYATEQKNPSERYTKGTLSFFCGHGVGRMLVLHALDFAGSRNFRQANLVSVQNSRSFWEKFGFLARELKSLETKDKLRSYGEDAIFMELNLEDNV